MPTTHKIAKRWTKLKWLTFLIFLIAAIATIFYFFVRIYHIDARSIGVKSSINSPIDESYSVNTVNGYVVYIPLLTNLKIYPTSILLYDLGEVKVHSQDGVEFVVSPKVSLQLDISKAGEYKKAFKDDIDKNPYVKEAIISSFVTVTSLYSTDSLIHNKATYEKRLTEVLSKKLKDEYFVLLKNVNTNIQYPDEVKDKIELNAKIKQEILVAETQAKLAYIEADSKRKKDSLEYTTLTKLSIQKLFIDKWDGRLAPNPEQPIMYRDINSNDDLSRINNQPKQGIIKKQSTQQKDSISTQ